MKGQFWRHGNAWRKSFKVLESQCFMKGKVNKKVVVQSVMALICLALMFFVSWWFIIPAVILMFLNQKELLWKNKFQKTEEGEEVE